MTSAMYVKAAPITTVLTYDAPTTAVGSVVPVAARLTTADGTSVMGQKVTFTNRDQIASAFTDATGRASTTMPMSDHGKRQTVHASFAGEGRYEPSSTMATIVWGR
jgi:hypothetical protein